MNRTWLKTAFCTSLSLCALNASASFQLTPYVGADAQLRKMPLEKGFGNNVTKANYPQSNFYVGLKLNDYVGLEGGYEQAKSRVKTTDLLGQDSLLGLPMIDDVDLTLDYRYKAKTKVHTFHISLVGFMPINQTSSTYLIGMLGMGRTSFKMYFDRIAIGNVPETQADIDESRRVFSKKRWVPKVGLGIQHMLNCRLGIRATGSYEKGLGRMTPINNPNSPLVAKLKKSIVMGVGFFYQFN